LTKGTYGFPWTFFRLSFISHTETTALSTGSMNTKLLPQLSAIEGIPTRYCRHWHILLMVVAYCLDFFIMFCKS